MKLSMILLCIVIVAMVTVMVFLSREKASGEACFPQLVGTYRADHATGLETLEIRGDGTYALFYEGPDGVSVTRKGQWKRIDFEPESFVNLINFKWGYIEMCSSRGPRSAELWPETCPSDSIYVDWKGGTDPERANDQGPNYSPAIECSSGVVLGVRGEFFGSYTKQ